MNDADFMEMFDSVNELPEILTRFRLFEPLFFEN